MEHFVLLGLLFPCFGFLSLLFTSDVFRRKFQECIGCITIFCSFVCFCLLLYNGQDLTYSLYSWIPIQGINAQVALHLDDLSLLMTLIITGVGFLIHVYSVGYMEHDKDVSRYFACMNFFIFSMLLLVLADNLLVFFVGWEGVGLASYLLIGFWYQKESASKAAKKAFIVNRIGDLGLLLGILLTMQIFGTAHIQSILESAKIGMPLLGVITFLYFFGATGKSAQFPLHVWLPDAMEGPTPVSALIHAATMVTAGVYLVVRMGPLFLLSNETLQIVGYVGGLTSLYAAFSASSQNDLKRVLAYSTISQLGLMFLACGVGAYYAAMFHLTTHAFVKALLFLSAGNVIHMMNDVTDMNQMGGLNKKFPKTNVLFLIGVLAMSGIPPLSIFFSKDLILEDEFIAGYMVLYVVGLLISVMTGFYLTRCYILTFRGSCKIAEALRDAPKVMMIPVSILGLLAIGGGLLGIANEKPPLLLEFLTKDSSVVIPQNLKTAIELNIETWGSIAVAVLGVGLAAVLYTRFRESMRKPFRFFLESFYFNQIYFYLIVKPLRILSKIIAMIIEPFVFDKTLELSTISVNAIAKSLQRVQSGQIRSYVSWIVLGAVLLLGYFIF